jgi:hypothetical protein
LEISVLPTASRKKTRRYRKQLLAFEAEFLRLQAFGDQDFEAFALCKSWLSEGQKDRAQTILAGYLKSRREQYPIPRYLAALIKPEHVQRDGVRKPTLG